MRRWGLAIALLLSLGVNVGVLATLAVHRLRPHEPRQESREPSRRDDPQAREQRMLGRAERMADRLELKGEVRARFVAQQRRFFLATAPDRARLASVHAELRQELTRDTPDRARVAALTGQAGWIYLALERALAENVLATRQMLGPEQEEAYLDFVRRLRPGRFSPPGLGERRFRRHGPRFRDRF